ncbi:hypothetical protein [Owenweeksia hongkongensis]|uniref:hypothetical protein n=1 Tax=Owenweeksia hongkongensis TaxID=253245 RepID=UPI003A91F08D
MYTGIKHLHSFLPYLLLAALVITIIIFAIKMSKGSAYTAADKRLSLITLILAHLQFVFGLVLYFISPVSKAALTAETTMSDATNRLYAVEHPLTMLVAIVLITIGYSKAKRKEMSSAKFKTVAIFFAIALILALVRIPWNVWPA